MQLKSIKLSSLFLLLFSVNIFASDTALIMHSSYSDAHTNVKSQLEEDGYTVTLQTSGVVPNNLISIKSIFYESLTIFSFKNFPLRISNLISFLSFLSIPHEM